MAIGPNSKKISETIKNINVSQQDKNRVTVSKDPNENVSRFINKKLVLPNATTKEAKPYVGTDNINTAASYENLLHRVKATKTKLIAINEAAFDKFSDEDIDSFLSWNLPKLTSVSLVYDYKDKFVADKKFEKWASNFKFTDDPKNAYEHYDPLIMSTKGTSNKSDYSQYFTETGLAIAEAYKSKVSEALQEYSANADNILVVSAADLAENPKIINKFIEADNDTKHKVLLSRSKYVLWGNPESIITSKQDKEKKSWDSIAFDGLKVYLEDDKADTFRSEFKSEPTKGFGTFTSNNGEPHIEYVVPESIKFLEYNDEKKDYSLAKAHIGALSAAAVTAANRTLGNLTIQNTTYKSYKTGETGN